MSIPKTPLQQMREGMEELESKKCEVYFSFNSTRACKVCLVRNKFTQEIVAQGEGHDDVTAFNVAFANMNKEAVERAASPQSVENASLAAKIRDLEAKLAAAEAAVPSTGNSKPSRLGLRPT